MLERIRISNLSLVFVDHPKNSVDVVKSQDTHFLSVVVSPSDFLGDHVLNLIVKLHVNHLLFQNVLIV